MGFQNGGGVVQQRIPGVLLRPIMPPDPSEQEFVTGGGCVRAAAAAAAPLRGCCYLFPDRLPSATFSFPASTNNSQLFVSLARRPDASCASIPQRLLTLTL
jgi:hypothetical protein